MPKIKLLDIKIEERMRKEYGNMDALAGSLQKYGLIEPIVLDEGMKLIAGGRRLKAAAMLKWQEIDYVQMNDLDSIQKKEIELEENIQRQQMGWQEEVSAKNEIHKLQEQLHGVAVRRHGQGDTWKQSDTAALLGESTGTVSMDLYLANGLKNFPELLKEKSKTAAYKKLKSLEERILHEALAERLKGKISNPSIIRGNCLEEMAKLGAASVDLILTDPPWGINIEDSHTFGRMTPQVTGFDDSEHATFNLLDKFIAEAWRVLKFDTHMYVFYGVEFYAPLRLLLEKHGFVVWPMPIIWDKGSGSYPSQQTSFVHSYEPILWCSKGKRLLNGSPRDIFPIKRVPSDKKIHPTEKPTELLRDLIKLSSMPGNLVLDPFCGSGSTIRAAKETGRQGLGIELDEVHYLKAVELLNTTV
jgi:DNA modification methylase